MITETFMWTPVPGTTPLDFPNSNIENPFGIDAIGIQFLKLRGIDPKMYDPARMTMYPLGKMSELK